MSKYDKDEFWRKLKADKYNEMNEKVRTKAILLLMPVVQDWGKSEDWPLLVKAIGENPDQWNLELGKEVPLYSFHFGMGMGIRNYLRQNNLTDDLLPEQNWDDYYMSVLERALNLEYGFDFPWMENIDET